MGDFEENWVTYRFEAGYGVIEFIAMFEDGYPNINICKNFQRYYIK